MTEQQILEEMDVENLTDGELNNFYEAFVEIIKDRKSVELMLMVDFPLSEYINRETKIPSKLRRAFERAFEWKRQQLQPRGVG